MKSVLQQNRENYADRWFRYVFCQCCMETDSAASAGRRRFPGRNSHGMIDSG